MLRTIYGFDDLGRKVPVGSYDDGLRAVGGRIFYIDPNSDETVEFYDAQGNVISNVVVGNMPAYYKITSAGVSGKDKFYVYKEEVYTNKVWTYYENGSWVHENTGFTSQAIGDGKSNTAGIMSLHDGAYITNNAYGETTIWYQIQQCQLNRLDNCNDWYIGTKGELEALRLFINEYISSLSLVNLFANSIWSSSDDWTIGAQGWSSGGSSWSGNMQKQWAMLGLIPIRSF